MKLDSKKLECTKDMVSLWNGLDPFHVDYISASNIMNAYGGEWDGFYNIATKKKNKNVFAAWTDKAKKMFLSIVSSNATDKKRQLKRLQDDAIWWAKNKGTPTDKKNINLENLLLPFRDLGYLIEENPDLYTEWCNIWLDRGWIKDERLLVKLLVRSVLVDNFAMVNRILGEYNLDPNYEVEIEDGEFSDFTFENTFYDPTIHTMKVGFFVKSEKVAKTLSKFGFNWDVSVCGGETTLLRLIQDKDIKDFASKTDRSKILEIIANHNLKDKSHEKLLIDILKGLKKEDSVKTILSGVDWKDIRGKNGENFMHMLAKYSPNAGLLRKYATTKYGLGLMNSVDKDGRYPAEYFLCFARKGLSVCRDSRFIEKLVKTGKVPRPDWLEVKLLVVENQATYSAVDSAPIDIWKQKTPEDFKECIDTDRGLKLIKAAVSHYQHKRLNHDINEGNVFDSYCGMNTHKYLYPDIGCEELFKLTKSENETKLYLIQSWLFIYKNFGSPWHSPFRSVFENRVCKATDKLLEQAFDSEINVLDIKESLLINWNSEDYYLDNSRFNDFMHEVLVQWKNIEIMRERKKLNDVIRNVDHKKSTAVDLAL